MTTDLHSENWNQGTKASMYSLLLAIQCAQKVTNLYIDLMLAVNTSNIAWTNLREIVLQTFYALSLNSGLIVQPWAWTDEVG